MNCYSVQRDLMAGRVRDRGMLEEHLNECSACARFARRFEHLEQVLKDHHTGVTPDPAFAVRVVAALPERSPVIGWAALRLLPATTALLLVLSTWVWFSTGKPAEMTAAAPTDDLVSWVLENGEASE